VAELDRALGITQVEEMTLDGVAMDIQGFSGLDDVPLVDHEPVEEVVAPQVIGKKTLLPEFG
jgi:hypothetical protein